MKTLIITMALLVAGTTVAQAGPTHWMVSAPSSEVLATLMDAEDNLLLVTCERTSTPAEDKAVVDYAPKIPIQGSGSVAVTLGLDGRRVSAGLWRIKEGGLTVDDPGRAAEILDTISKATKLTIIPDNLPAKTFDNSTVYEVVKAVNTACGR